MTTYIDASDNALQTLTSVYAVRARYEDGRIDSDERIDIYTTAEDALEDAKVMFRAPDERYDRHHQSLSPANHVTVEVVRRDSLRTSDDGRIDWSDYDPEALPEDAVIWDSANPLTIGEIATRITVSPYVDPDPDYDPDEDDECLPGNITQDWYDRHIGYTDYSIDVLGITYTLRQYEQQPRTDLSYIADMLHDIICYVCDPERDEAIPDDDSVDGISNDDVNALRHTGYHAYTAYQY